MNILKFIVVFLGILLVAASIITLVLVLQRGVKQTEKTHPVAQTACLGGDISIDRENGFKSFKTEGNLVLLHIQGLTGKDKIIVVDSCAGKAISTIVLE